MRNRGMDWGSEDHEGPPGASGLQYVWVTGDRRHIPVDQMTDEHLVNALNWVENPPRGPNDEQMHDGYFYLRAEAMKRGLRWRRFRGQALHDGDFHRGCGPQPTPNIDGSPILGHVKFGTRFRTLTATNRLSDLMYMKLSPYGAVLHALADRGYVVVDGSIMGRDGVGRSLVTNLTNGSTFMMPNYQRIARDC